MPLLSMTGFGRATAAAGDRRLAVEIRSVNHRGLDVKVRTREPDAVLEAEAARAVRGAIERGSVTVSIREEAADAGGLLDGRRVRAAHAELEALRRDLGMPQPVDLGTVAAFLAMSGGGGGELRGEAYWEVLRPAFEAALADLRRMRAREGEALAADLRGRAARLRELRGALEQATAPLPQRFARRLEERLAQLGGKPGVEPARLAQEAAVLAERLDVSEELTRLGSHLDQLDGILSGTAGAREAPAGGGVGRRLDFLVQEIGRELNTTGSKSQDATVAQLVIDAKVELEKLREQVQNVE